MHLVQLKPKTSVEKRTQTVTDTIMLTPELVRKWKAPPFQRPIKQNKKVLALAEQLKTEGGVIRGIITLGILNGIIYLLDGQHRIEAFLISGLKEAYTDVRKHYFETMAEMGDEWVLLNSQLVRMNSDDILRGLEPSTSVLQVIRKKCSFIGYDSIRRSENSPVLSMSVTLRSWRGSMAEVPTLTNGLSAKEIAEAMTEPETNDLCDFLQIALGSFGRDKEYRRLWGSLNLTLCMWMYRRVVKTQWSPKVPKFTVEVFKKCLVSLSASEDYLDWLLGRSMNERDRSPAYARLRRIFQERLFAETGKRHAMPQPAWFHTT